MAIVGQKGGWKENTRDLTRSARRVLAWQPASGDKCFFLVQENVLHVESHLCFQEEKGRSEHPSCTCCFSSAFNTK